MSPQDDTLRQKLRQQLEEFRETDEGKDILRDLVESLTRNSSIWSSTNTSVRKAMKGVRNDNAIVMVSAKGIFLHG